MQNDVRIRSLGPWDRNLLIGMYDRFDSIGAFFGLPPHTAESRREWIARALRHAVNVAAFSPAGHVAGHCFLAADMPGTAELAIFVHQDHRRKGVGTALVNAALDRAGAAGFQSVWSLASSENRAALRLLDRVGFRVSKTVLPAIELEIDLAEFRISRAIAQPFYIV